jgi:hypothetical protein
MVFSMQMNSCSNALPSMKKLYHLKPVVIEPRKL